MIHGYQRMCHSKAAIKYLYLAFLFCLGMLSCHILGISCISKRLAWKNLPLQNEKRKAPFSPSKWKKCALFSSYEMLPFFKKVWLGYLNKTKVAHGYIIHFHFLPVFHKYQQCLSWYYKQNLFRIVKPECYFQEHLFSNGFCSEYLENHISFF